MIDDITKRSILDEILASTEFKSSSINKKLLSYLVELSIKKIKPSEYNIASDVFCKKENFNPNEDTIVRVSVHNLRKKLLAYYRNEGKRAKIQIEIPKGHYEVSFVRVNKKRLKEILLGSNFLLLIIISIMVIIMLSQLKILSLKKYVGERIHVAHHPIWKDILKKNRPKLIVLGDDFFFLQQIDNEEIIVRKHNINSNTDLAELMQKNIPNTIKGKTPYAFVPMASIKPLLRLFPLFESETRISLQYSSRLESTDLLENDLIFFGAFRNLYILNEVIKENIHSYQVGRGMNSLTLSLQDSLYKLQLKGNPAIQHSDYCFVIKKPGPSKNTIILFVSFFESGMIGAINYLTNIETLKELDNRFIKKYGVCPQYFDILFKTTGFSRTAFTTSVVYINKIDPQDVSW